MEREYIERNAVLEEALNNGAVRLGIADKTGIKEIINDVPSADVVSVREYQELADENRELKRLLGIAIADFESVTKMCDGTQCESCPHNYLRNYPCECCEWQYKDEAEKLLKGDTVEAVADVVPVKHGKWRTSKSCVLPANKFVCSECDGLVIVSTYRNRCLYNYCPNCGAKMDGD